MDALDKEAGRLVRMAWAPRTLQMYEVGMSAFRNFRAEYNCKNLNAPANSIEVTRFIARLSLQNKAPSTIAAYVSAISNWHKSHRLPDPSEDYMVKKALKGGSREHNNADLREPITIDLLTKLVAALKPVCDSHYEQVMFKCAYLLAFFGLFRIGEFAADTKYKAQKTVIRLEDVAIQGNTLKITIRFSKTDQKGLANGITLKGQVGSLICPVQAAKEFLAIRGTKNGAFFMHYNGTYLSRYQFNSVLASTLKFADPSKPNVKAHSFRIGGATNAMSKGIPYSKIQEMGRWHSHAAKRYIRHVSIDVASLN